MFAYELLLEMKKKRFSGFLSRPNINWALQSQEKARSLKF